jgi:putative lipoprotein
VPFNFALSYESASIREGGTYTVRAQIYVDGNLQRTSDTSYPVITNGESSADITVVQVPESDGGEADMAGTFGTVTGTVTYRQRIVLPPEAVVLVELAHVSRADAPAFVLASQQFITNGRQVPLSFSLNYDTASITRQGTYTISAKVLINGELAWITDASNPVISNGVSNIDVMLVQ